MAKTYTQVIGLIALLTAGIAITSLTSSESILGLALVAVPALGFYIIVKAVKAGVSRNLEFLATGIALFILGITTLIGDAVLLGFSVRSVGFTVAIGALILLAFNFASLWEGH